MLEHNGILAPDLARDVKTPTSDVMTAGLFLDPLFSCLCNSVTLGFSDRFYFDSRI